VEIVIMRSEFHVDSVKILVLESHFLAVGHTGRDVPPICLSTVWDVLNETITNWRLVSGLSLAQANVLALDSIFKRASEADPPQLAIGDRYWQGHSEYEVTAVKDDCVWLVRADSPRQEAAELNSQATSIPDRKDLPTRTFVRQVETPAKVKEQRPNPLKHSRLDRQPEAIKRLILDEVCSSYRVRGLSKQSLVKNIACRITRLNESRSSNEQFKVPSSSTLRRLICDLQENYHSPRLYGSAYNEHGPWFSPL
jgi:hypothetical protein